MNYDLLLILLLPFSGHKMEPNYKKAADAVQQISWKKSYIKKSGEITAVKIRKKYPEITSTLAMFYLFGVKKEVAFSTKKGLPIKGSTVSVNFNYNTMSGSINLSFPLELR